MPNRRTQFRRLISILIGLVALMSAPTHAFAEGVGGMYLGDLGQAIAAIVIFLLLLAVLGKWAWKPIISQLHQREQRISESVEHAEIREKKAEQLLAEYQDHMDKTHAEAQEILAEGRREAGKLKEEVLAAARASSQKFARQARREIAQARAETLQEMREITAHLAIEMTERILRKNLDSEEHNRLVQESLEDISQHASGEL